MNEIAASQLTFDTPLFGSFSPKKIDNLETITALPSTDYQNDANYNHKLPKQTSVMKDSDSSSDSDSASESDDSKKESHNGSRSKSDSALESDDSHNSSKEQQLKDNEDSNSKSESEDEKSEDQKNESEKSDDESYENDAADSSSSSDDSADKSTNKKKQTKKTAKLDWEEAPDLYGIRRSSRQRKEPTRFIARQTSDSDEHPRRRNKKRKDSSDWRDSDSSSDSDSDEFKPSRRTVKRQTRANQKAKIKQRGRGRKKSSYYDSDSDDRRHSKRGVAAKVSYKESSDDLTDSDDLIEMEEPAEPQENKETIEKIIDDRIGRKGATGSKTTSYNCEDNVDPNANLDVENEETERQYLIKWKNWAHIHDTWETEEALREQKVNGLKKLDNWKKKEEEIREWREQANPEDIEYYDCQQEMMQDLYLKYKNVERIVVHTSQKVANENNGYPDYLVKWCGLPYSDCTWEDGELISRKYQSAIDEYYVRNKSQRIPSKICKALKTRPKFSPLKSQPSYIGGVDSLELRDYQLDGVNWLIHSWTKWNSVILADEMGLGKTIQTIGLLSQIHNAYQVYGPFLIVVPLSTLAAWQKEFRVWAPEINVVVYIGDVASRTMIREHEWSHPGNKRLKFNVLLTTYEILLKDKSFLGNVNWAMLMVDEAHRLKNDDSLLYRTLKDFTTNHRLLITGTPLQNSLKELWALLHFIMSEKIGTWPEFEEKHSHSDKTGFAALHRELEPFLLRRVKKDVEKSLPSKVEQILRVEMTSLQKQYYRWILTKNYRELTKGLKGKVASFVNIIMELKKCCNHCRLTRPDEEDQGDMLQQLLKGSGKLLLLDKLLCRLKDTGHRVLIFSQMVMMLDILAEYMRLKHFHYQRLDGTIRGDVRKQALEHFNAEGSPDFCFLLSTRAGGLGINLATADTVIIFDSDWNPQNDLQAQARAHRIGQKNQVSVYRLITKKSVEEEIVERAKKKMVLDHLVIQRMDTTGRTVLNREHVASSSNTPFNKEELSSILKFGAEELFKEAADDDEEPQVDIDEILKYAETHETDDTGVGDELLSQFKVVSFDNLEKEHIDSNENTMDTIDNGGKDWDELIPEADRRKVEEEERQQQLMELHLPPRQRKTIQQLQMEYDSDENKGRRRKKQDDDDSDASDDDEPKKRGRPRTSAKDIGFSDKEIRQFVKSYKKFINPITRLDAIACDAELQEKSESDLKRLAEILQKGCEQAVDEHKQKLSEDPTIEAGKKSNRGPSFKLYGVIVNAQSVLKSVQELGPLDACIPQDKQERSRFVLDMRVKPAHWDCIWEIEDDSNLLKGVYEYGFGNWEQIKMDPELHLADKILPHGDIKPQGKHIQTRVEYLIKTVKASQDPSASTNTASSGRVRKRKPKSRAEIIEKDDSDSDSPPHHSVKEETNDSLPDATKKKKKKPEKSDSDISDDEVHEDEKKKNKKVGKDKGKKLKKKKPDKDGPKHFTASSEPVDIADEDGAEIKLTPEIFQQCKEKMRSVKKSLKLLGKPDPGLSQKQEISQTRRCLLEIGDRISECLSDFNDLEKIKAWRNYLWIFVSQFTSSEAKKLHKFYKLSVKKREENKDKHGAKPNKHEHDSSKVKKSKDDHDHSKSKKKETKREKHKSRKGDDAEHHNDRSHDSASSGAHHAQASVSSHSSNHPTSFRNVLGNHDPSGRPDGSSSPSDKWVRSSPLDRDEDIPHKGYNTGSHSYNRPHSDHRGFYGQQYSGDHSRFNNDRRSDHPSYNSYRDSGYSSYRQNRPDRGDHRLEYRPDQRGDHHHRPEYGNHYRESKFHRPADDRRSDGYQSHSERKRKPEDYYNRDKVSSKERRLTNDPRLDPRLSSDNRHSSYSLENKSQDAQ